MEPLSKVPTGQGQRREVSVSGPRALSPPPPILPLFKVSHRKTAAREPGEVGRASAPAACSSNAAL